MEAFAISRSNRISVKKLMRVTKVVSKMTYLQALNKLEFFPQKAAFILKKLLKSAGFNLLNKNPQIKDNSKWVIKEIIVNRGAFLKRIRPRARGRADRICKPTSHVKIIISEKN